MSPLESLKRYELFLGFIFIFSMKFLLFMSNKVFNKIFPQYFLLCLSVLVSKRSIMSMNTVRNWAVRWMVPVADFMPPLVYKGRAGWGFAVPGRTTWKVGRIRKNETFGLYEFARDCTKSYLVPRIPPLPLPCKQGRAWRSFAIIPAPKYLPIKNTWLFRKRKYNCIQKNSSKERGLTHVGNLQ